MGGQADAPRPAANLAFAVPVVMIWLAMSLLSPSDAAAQGLRGCTATTFTDPPRTAYSCSGGLVIEVERAADFSAPETGRARTPDTIDLNGNAILIDLAPRRGRFQIRTPHAIASVRGTIYVVDVSASGTAVFVAEGRVSVRRRETPESVLLEPGEGVDVSPGTPLQVRRWPQERAVRLLARFSR